MQATRLSRRLTSATHFIKLFRHNPKALQVSRPQILSARCYTSESTEPDESQSHSIVEDDSLASSQKSIFKETTEHLPRQRAALDPPRQPLPDLPSASHTMLDDVHWKQFVYPLYLRGWGYQASWISFKAIAPVLFKQFRFQNRDDLFDFVAQLNPVVKEENHHPHLNMHDRSLDVKLCTTHVEDEKGKRISFVTLLDIRMAYTMERLFDRYAEESGFSFRPFEVARILRPSTGRQWLRQMQDLLQEKRAVDNVRKEANKKRREERGKFTAAHDAS